MTSSRYKIINKHKESSDNWISKNEGVGSISNENEASCKGISSIMISLILVVVL